MRTTSVAAAVNALQQGRIVAIPTETVYGLAANARNQAAVARIYEVKGRPSDHPVIVHLADSNQISEWATAIPEWANRLAETFWPGPLTLILPKLPEVGSWITGGQQSIGLRVPDHPLTLEVLRTSGLGLAAPSANRFGSLSPTDAAAVEIELGSYLADEDLILDGGACTVGVESTIVDCTASAPSILRLGAITAEEIAIVTGLDLIAANSQQRAPGTLANHYAPNAKVCTALSPACQGLIALADVPTPEGVRRLASPTTMKEYAQQLYAAMRTADQTGLTCIAVIPPEGNGLAAAITDRINRASA